MAQIRTAQAPNMVLVANLEGSGDPSQGLNPTKIRTGFRKQGFPEIGRAADPGGSSDALTPGMGTRQGFLSYTTSPLPVSASATVSVDDADFTSQATLLLGGFTVTSGDDFDATPGTADEFATRLAAAVDGLPGFAAVAVANEVTVTGPPGLRGNDVLFDVRYAGTVANYTLSPTTGSLQGGEPTLGPPEIL